jgi:HK97 family phage major capsid protein
MSESTLTDNRTILEKADLALSDLTSSGGLLEPAQAAKFIRLAIKNSKLLQMATVVPMRSPKQSVEQIRFAGRILRAGQEATALPAADRSKPNLGKIELDAKLFKGEVRLDNEVLEDSIERGELRNTIMTLMTEAVSRDMEEVAIQGDTTSADAFLAQFDGALKQATSHVVDASNAYLNKTIFRDMVKAMPIEYRRDKSKLKLVTSTNAEIGYRDSLSERATVLGDKYLADSAPASYAGIQVVDIPLFPEDLGVGNDTTNALFCDPKNLNVGIWRKIRIETDKLVSEGVLVIVVTLRFDVRYTVEDAVVKAINITV